jgi:hypothetical protein
MPKVRWDNSSAEDIDGMEPDEGPEYYDGPVPPRGVYRFQIKGITYEKFSTGSKGLKVFAVIDEARGEKKRYNGAPAWENIIDTEGSRFKIRQFLDAIGAKGRDWENVIVDADMNVTKIGKIVVNDRLYLRASTKVGKNQEDEKRMEIARFLPLTDATEADAPEGDDDSEPPF